jgi:type I restriction enzyme S subunit
MMQDFPTNTIEKVSEALIDYRGKTPPKSDAGVKLITAKVMKQGFVQKGDHEYITADTYNKWMTRGLPQQWDILITTEAPLGEVAQLRTSEKVALAQRIILLRGDPCIIDQSYYFYALRSPFIQAQLMARATGTTVLGIKQSELRQVEVPLPPMSVQRKIAVILSAYDDLIENNTRRIAILEEMAQMLYREWFVRFHFPGHEDVVMANADAHRLGMNSDYHHLSVIPEGWKLQRLGDLAHRHRRGADPEDLPADTPYIGLGQMPKKSIALAEWGNVSESKSRKYGFKEGEILFGRIRPYFHKVGVAPLDGVCSTDIIVIDPKSPECFSLVLGCVSSDLFVEYATQTSSGTKMPRAKWDVLANYPVAVPPERLLQRHNVLIGSTVSMIRNLIFRNQVLREARDSLLPRLVSGKLDVSDLDIVTRDAD